MGSPDGYGARPRTVLHVFVSSPADCSEERDVVEAVVAEVSDSAEAHSSHLELKTVRWENLPPGETVGRDYQGRIDDLMARAELDRFEIYVGFIRERVGTPTRGYPSGTLSEFASARERRRASGLPAELLFYFLCDDPSMTPTVVAIREEFEQRGFLYSVAATREVFRARLREHLIHIVSTWWNLKNRLRRQLRHVRIGLAYISAALVAGYAAFDLATLNGINRRIADGDLEAAVSTWHDRNGQLLITRWAGASTIDSTLRRVASARLADSLIAQGYDPFSWKGQHLRSFEFEALAAHGRTVLATHARSDAVVDPSSRLAWAVLAEDWVLLRQMATTAARDGLVYDPPVVKGFIAHAPAEHVRAWLREDLDGKLPSHIAGRILEAVSRRAEPDVTFAALDALANDRLGGDAKKFDLHFDCDTQNPVCRISAAAMLREWLAKKGALPQQGLEVLLRWATTDQWSHSDLQKVERTLCQWLTKTTYSDISSALIEFLAKWHAECGSKQLAARIQAHVDGRISFGFQERAALIDALPSLGLPSQDKLALAIAKRSTAEASALAGNQFVPSDAIVQAAHIRLLASHAAADWRLHSAWVKQTLSRRLRGQYPDFQRSIIDDAFSALLVTADGSRLSDLFGKVMSPVLDSLDGKLSTSRAYLLDRLPRQSAKLPVPIVEDVCRAVPALESNRPSFYRALAVHGGSTGLECLRWQFQNDAKAAEYLAEAGDAETLIRALQAVAPAKKRPSGALPPVAALDLHALVDAAARLPAAVRASFVGAAQEADPPVDPAVLWPLAAELGSNRELESAAIAEISTAKDLKRIVKAIEYLTAMSRTADLWTELESNADRLAELMRRVDAFDWIGVAQILPDPPPGVGHRMLDACFSGRRVLLALGSGQATPSAVLPDRLLGVGGKWIGNPIGRLLVRLGGQQASSVLHSARNAVAGPIEVVGSLPDSRAAYRAYTGWLLSEAVATAPMAARSLVDRRTISGWIGDSDPLASRVMAGLTLAAIGPDTAGD